MVIPMEKGTGLRPENYKKRRIKTARSGDASTSND